MYQMETSGQPLNIGQNGQKTMGPKHVRYSEVPLYCVRMVAIIIIGTCIMLFVNIFLLLRLFHFTPIHCYLSCIGPKAGSPRHSFLPMNGSFIFPNEERYGECSIIITKLLLPLGHQILLMSIKPPQ